MPFGGDCGAGRAGARGRWLFMDPPARTGSFPASDLGITMRVLFTVPLVKHNDRPVSTTTCRLITPLLRLMPGLDPRQRAPPPTSQITLHTARRDFPYPLSGLVTILY